MPPYTYRLGCQAFAFLHEEGYWTVLSDGIDHFVEQRFFVILFAKLLSSSCPRLARGPGDVAHDWRSGHGLIPRAADIRQRACGLFSKVSGLIPGVRGPHMGGSQVPQEGGVQGT